MKTLIIYNIKGNVVSTIAGTSIEDNYKCLVANIEEGKELVSIDVESNAVITRDKNTRVQDIKTYLNNVDETTVANIEKSILATEKNKIIEKEGM